MGSGECIKQLILCWEQTSISKQLSKKISRKRCLLFPWKVKKGPEYYSPLYVSENLAFHFCLDCLFDQPLSFFVHRCTSVYIGGVWTPHFSPVTTDIFPILYISNMISPLSFCTLESPLFSTTSEVCFSSSYCLLFVTFGNILICWTTVSYTHLTLPTICSV